MKKLLLKIYFLFRLPFLYLLKFLLYVWYKFGNGSFIFGQSISQLPSKILIIRIDRIGDFILSLPAIKALKTNFQDSHITIIVSEYLKDLAESYLYIDNVLVYNKESSFFKKILFIKKLKNYYFDLAIDMHSDYKIETAILTYVSKASIRIGFSEGFREIFFTKYIKLKSIDKKKSFVDIIYSLLSLIDIFVVPDDPELVPSLDSRKKITKFLEDNRINRDSLIIGIHPGGFYESQRWDVTKFAELIRLIKEKYNNSEFIIFGSKNETELVEILKDKILLNNLGHHPSSLGTRKGQSRLLTVTDFSVSETVALISKFDLLICNNSGPLHIASALSIPTVSTMGPTDPYLWMPKGDKNIVIRKNLSCSPCNKGICKTHECMKLITIEDMFNAVEIQLKVNSIE